MQRLHHLLLTGDNPVIEISLRDKPGVHALLAEQLHDDMTGRGACYKFPHTASWPGHTSVIGCRSSLDHQFITPLSSLPVGMLPLSIIQRLRALTSLLGSATPSVSAASTSTFVALDRTPYSTSSPSIIKQQAYGDGRNRSEGEAARSQGSSGRAVAVRDERGSAWQNSLAMQNAPQKVFELIGDPRSGLADNVTNNAFGEVTVDLVHHQLSNEVYWYKYEFAGNMLKETHRDSRLSEHAKNLIYVLRAKDPLRQGCSFTSWCSLNACHAGMLSLYRYCTGMQSMRAS